MDAIFRQLPNFKGKRRLAKWLFRQKITRISAEPVSGKFSCSYHLPNLIENVGLDIFVNGVYEENTINFLNRLIPPNGGYIDIGANIGALLIPLCKIRKDINAIGVEAAPWIFEYLVKNIHLNNLKNVTFLNHALFDKDGITLDFFSPHDKFGKGSLAPVFSKEAVPVNSKTLDTIIKENDFQRVDAVKVDVEGFEYFVFNGATQLAHEDSAPDIVFEFVDWAEQLAMGLAPGSAQRKLVEFGYTLFKIEKNSLQKLNNVIESGAADLFATKRNSDNLFISHK